MTAEKSMNQGRRLLLGGAATVLAAAAVPAFAQQNSTEMETQATGQRNNISSFKMKNWQDYFDNSSPDLLLYPSLHKTYHCNLHPTGKA